jgi:hypothetical protein
MAIISDQTQLAILANQTVCNVLPDSIAVNAIMYQHYLMAIASNILPIACKLPSLLKNYSAHFATMVTFYFMDCAFLAPSN